MEEKTIDEQGSHYDIVDYGHVGKIETDKEDAQEGEKSEFFF
jgi:hypothetical protein